MYILYSCGAFKQPNVQVAIVVVCDCVSTCGLTCDHPGRLGEYRWCASETGAVAFRRILLGQQHFISISLLCC
jgi:hypothetical protein